MAGWGQIEIRKALLDKQVTQAELARLLDVKKEQLNAVIHGRSPTPYIRRFLATILNAPFEEVWGEPDPGRDVLRGEGRRRRGRVHSGTNTTPKTDTQDPS